MFSVRTGLWLMCWLGFNLTVAVAVGFIALAGVAPNETCASLNDLSAALF
jgi:Cu(I)/Ag(I) efflux system membrane protein CusA/SilA